MIEIRQLQKRFGDVTAVDGLSFAAPDAAILLGKRIAVHRGTR